MVSWIFAQLDQPAQAKSTPVYRVPAVDDVVEILFLPQNQPVSAFQAEATRIRTVTNIRRVYTYNRLRALLVRGTASEVAEARRLVADLKQ